MCVWVTLLLLCSGLGDTNVCIQHHTACNTTRWHRSQQWHARHCDCECRHQIIKHRAYPASVTPVIEWLREYVYPCSRNVCVCVQLQLLIASVCVSVLCWLCSLCACACSNTGAAVSSGHVRCGIPVRQQRHVRTRNTPVRERSMDCVSRHVTNTSHPTGTP